MYPSKGYLWVNWLAVQKMEEFTGPWPGLRTQMSQVILNQMLFMKPTPSQLTGPILWIYLDELQRMANENCKILQWGFSNCA